MDARQFRKNSPGELVSAAHDKKILAFVPNRLPPTIQLTSELFSATSEAANALGRLQGAANALPEPMILIRSFIRREAQLSSYIENTFARYEEVAAAEQKDDSAENGDTREVLNAERAIEAGVDAVFRKNYPINNQLLRRMHEILLAGVRGQPCAGAFRNKQVYIGRQEDGVSHARFVPPPPYLLNELMQDFEAYIRSENSLPSLVQIAIVHYQFETIHPFEDGNGRLGRILILLGLCQHKLLTLPIMNASLHFERNKQRYYDSLLRVSTDGDWHGWILFFLRGLFAATNESIAKLRELTELQRRYHDQVQAARNSSLLLRLVDNLFIRPVVTISQAGEIMGVTYQAAQSSVRKLVGMRILQPLEAALPAKFVAKEILEAVNPEPTPR